MHRAHQVQQAASVRPLPLVDCPYCRRRIIRFQSKTPGTAGLIFFKCEANVQHDPMTCRFYKWEPEYRRWLQRHFSDAFPFPTEDMNQEGEYIQLKHDIVELKQVIALLKHEIGDMRKKPMKSRIVDDRLLLCVMSVVAGLLLGLYVSICMQSVN